MIFTKKDKRTKLEKEIDAVLECMEDVEPDSDEYTKMAENLGRLYKAKECEPKRGVSPDTKALIVANLVGLAIVLTYEKTNVIAGKAFGMIVKGRV